MYLKTDTLGRSEIIDGLPSRLGEDAETKALKAVLILCQKAKDGDDDSKNVLRKIKVMAQDPDNIKAQMMWSVVQLQNPPM